MLFESKFTLFLAPFSSLSSLLLHLTGFNFCQQDVVMHEKRRPTQMSRLQLYQSSSLSLSLAWLVTLLPISSACPLIPLGSLKCHWCFRFLARLTSTTSSDSSSMELLLVAHCHNWSHRHNSRRMSLKLESAMDTWSGTYIYISGRSPTSSFHFKTPSLCVAFLAYRNQYHFEETTKRPLRSSPRGHAKHKLLTFGFSRNRNRNRNLPGFLNLCLFLALHNREFTKLTMQAS